MPTPSDITIRLAGVDITHKVLFASAGFEAQLGAIPGMAEITIKDLDQTFAAVTGQELTLDLDGVRYWGGYVMTVSRIFALPVVDTSTPGAVRARQFKLTAVDYNILFDKRVIHNPADHLNAFPYFTLDKTMGQLLRTLFANYVDDMADFDTVSYIDNLFAPRFDADGNPAPNGTKKGTYVQQGSYLRKQMDDFAQFGAVYYISANKKVHFHEVEDTVASWGFSDVPNKLPVGTPGATYGMREYEDSESAAAMANDAFVWGGSEWAGSGGTVFKRKSNAVSIAAHRRWQYPEVRFGDLRTQGEVTARANVIVSGNTTGAVGGDTSRGLSVVELRTQCVWFGHDVPFDGGVRAHLKPSDVVTFTMFCMSKDGGLTPRVIVLPLRSVRISFPTLPPDGTAGAPKTYVRFEGQFGLQTSDPWYFWKLLRDLRSESRPVTSAANGSAPATYGALGSFAPTPAADNVATVFSIPYAYIGGTTQVFKGPAGQLALLTLATDYTESDPATGEITFTAPPSSAHDIWVICRIAGGVN